MNIEDLLIVHDGKKRDFFGSHRVFASAVLRILASTVLREIR